MSSNPFWVYLGRDKNDPDRGAIGTLEPRRPGWKTRTFKTGCLCIQVLEVDVRPFDPNTDRVANP